MSVRCPGCGRSYGPHRFPLGRTVRCTCGHRVGPGARVPLADPAPGAAGAPPRFAADAMLGRLARWLRALGFDTTLEGDGSDERLVRRAAREGRVILTRDRRLPEEWRVRPVVVLSSDDPEAQLRALARRYDLAGRARPFTRCTRCNAPLETPEPEDVARRVPEAVRRRTRRFLRCPACRRIYWAGSHTRRMERRLRRALLRPERGGRDGPVGR